MYFTLTIEKGSNSDMTLAICILNHHFELNSTSLLHGWCDAQKLSLAGQVGPRLSLTVKHTGDVLMWWAYAQARYHYRSPSKHMSHTRRQGQKGYKGVRTFRFKRIHLWMKYQSLQVILCIVNVSDYINIVCMCVAICG